MADAAIPGMRSGNDYLQLVLLSDTHELHHDVNVPEGDILIHAGDFTMFAMSAAAILDFDEWLGDLSHRHKFVICGNHEVAFASSQSLGSLIKHARVLSHEVVRVDGLKIWGSLGVPLTAHGGQREDDLSETGVREDS